MINKLSITRKLPIVIDCIHIFDTDYTAVETIKAILKGFDTKAQPLFFYRPVLGLEKVLQAGGVDFQGFENFSDLESKIDDYGDKRTSL